MSLRPSGLPARMLTICTSGEWAVGWVGAWASCGWDVGGRSELHGRGAGSETLKEGWLTARKHFAGAPAAFRTPGTVHRTPYTGHLKGVLQLPSRQPATNRLLPRAPPPSPLLHRSEPQFSNADRSCLWELTSLAAHVHPSGECALSFTCSL